MQIEYEATFINIDKEECRKKLKEVGAKLIKPEFLQRRVVFHLPKGHEIKGAWLRVRDESDKITMSLKIVDGDKIENQKELCLTIDNFDEGVKFLSEIGCERKAYQETKREKWDLDGVEICIDEWPFLEPFMEIEGKSEEKVKSVAEKLGLDYSKAMFCATGAIYSKKYGLPEEVFNNDIPEITFSGENPFLKYQK
jgi:adenylate cyclase class 2